MEKIDRYLCLNLKVRANEILRKFLLRGGVKFFQ